MMMLEDAKAEVLRTGLRLLQEKLVARTWGNVSCRVDENSFVITPSGRCYTDLQSWDIVPVRIDTLKWTGPIRPSSERGLHAEIYKLNREIGVIIHTHQVNASVVASARRDIPLNSRERERFCGKVIPCAAYSLPGTKQLKKAVAKVLAESGSRAALLANHGAVCFGGTPEDAVGAALRLEVVCEDYIRKEFLQQTSGGTGDEESRIAFYLSSLRKR